MLGHSKGGAEAVANAVATNKNAIVFNPATAFLEKYDLSTKEYTGNITSYVVQGEALDSLSGILGKNIGVEIPLYSTKDYSVHTLKWDSNVLGAQEPSAQAGQFIGTSIANAFGVINEKIDKHLLDAVIELLIKKSKEGEL